MMRRILPLVALTLMLGACRADPLKDYGIEAVELRSAPKLEFLRARAGMKFLEVRFSFENRSGAPVTLKAIDFALRDTHGTLHPYSAQVLNMGQPRGRAEAEVPAGLRLSGSVVFQIPAAEVPAELIYRYDLGGGLVVRFSSSG